MIKFNETYSINDGQGTIVFKDAGNNKVEATYEIKGNKVPGNVSGKFEGSTLKAIYQVNEAKGLMDFIFSKNGFEAKWKKGVEEGPMKGNWTGKILEDEKNKPIITSNPTNEKVNSSTKTDTLMTLIDKEKDLNDRLVKLNAEILEKEVKLNLLVNQIAQKEQQLQNTSKETDVTPPKKKIQEYSNVYVQIKITTSQKFTNSYSCSSYNLPQPGDTTFYNLIFKVHYQYKITKAKLRAVLEQASTDVSYSNSEGYALELIDINDDSSYSTKRKFEKSLAAIFDQDYVFGSHKEFFKLSIISFES